MKKNEKVKNFEQKILTYEKIGAKIRLFKKLNLMIGGGYMTFNYDKLRGRIVEKYGTQGRLAKELGVSERTLSLKLNNKIFFTQDEIARMSMLLNINLERIQYLFFEQKVQ